MFDTILSYRVVTLNRFQSNNARSIYSRLDNERIGHNSLILANSSLLFSEENWSASVAGSVRSPILVT